MESRGAVRSSARLGGCSEVSSRSSPAASSRPDAAAAAAAAALRRARVAERAREVEDSPRVLREKCRILARALRNAKHLVVYTGAGISTAADIPDYRGPRGVWTRLQRGETVGRVEVSRATPTFTHMALTALWARGALKFVVSQNCDGLHLRAGLPRRALAELHGDMFAERCNSCRSVYLRAFDTTERTARHAHGTRRLCHTCGTELRDTIVHFGERGRAAWPLNWAGALRHAAAADVILCLGSSLKVLRRYPRLWCMQRAPHARPALYVVNLQWTPKDAVAALKINARCDRVMTELCRRLRLRVPPYRPNRDPLLAHATPLAPAEAHTTRRPLLRVPSPDFAISDTSSSSPPTSPSASDTDDEVPLHQLAARLRPSYPPASTPGVLLPTSQAVANRQPSRPPPGLFRAFQVSMKSGDATILLRLEHAPTEQARAPVIPLPICDNRALFTPVNLQTAVIAPLPIPTMRPSAPIFPRPAPVVPPPIPIASSSKPPIVLPPPSAIMSQPAPVTLLPISITPLSNDNTQPEHGESVTALVRFPFSSIPILSPPCAPVTPLPVSNPHLATSSNQLVSPRSLTTFVRFPQASPSAPLISLPIPNNLLSTSNIQPISTKPLASLVSLPLEPIETLTVPPQPAVVSFPPTSTIHRSSSPLIPVTSSPSSRPIDALRRFRIVKRPRDTPVTINGQSPPPAGKVKKEETEVKCETKSESLELEIKFKKQDSDEQKLDCKNNGTLGLDSELRRLLEEPRNVKLEPKVQECDGTSAREEAARVLAAAIMRRAVLLCRAQLYPGLHTILASPPSVPSIRSTPASSQASVSRAECTWCLRMCGVRRCLWYPVSLVPAAARPWRRERGRKYLCACCNETCLGASSGGTVIDDGGWYGKGYRKGRRRRR